MTRAGAKKKEKEWKCLLSKDAYYTKCHSLTRNSRDVHIARGSFKDDFNDEEIMN